MRPQTVRFIDQWLGRPACALLSLARPIAHAVRRHDAERAPRKILFIKLTEQGASVLACAAMRRAIELVGRENVYFWVFQENREIVELTGLVPTENILTVRADSVFTFAFDMARSLRRIRRLGIDSTVDMEFFARASVVMACLTGARNRVGLHRFTSEGPYRGDLMTHRVNYNPYLHTAAAYWTLVEALAHPPGEIPTLKFPLPDIELAPSRFEPSAQETAAVRAALNRLAGYSVTSPIVLLNPNAGDMLPMRKWPAESFVALGKRILLDFPEVTIVITGSTSEREAAAEIAHSIAKDRVVNMAGETTLRELMVLYTIADVLVTNDSGPGHFASMTDIDAVCLFGPETPALYAPLGAHTHVIWAGLACSPCVNVFNHRFSPCRRNVCMEAISVSQVFDKVRDLLAARTPAHA